MIIVPQKLRDVRGSMSRIEAAKRLGITRQQVWAYETGRDQPSLSALAKLLELYNAKLEDVADEKFLALK